MPDKDDNDSCIKLDPNNIGITSWSGNGRYTINTANTITSKMVYLGNDTYFKDAQGDETSANEILERLKKIEERLFIIDKLSDEESVMLKSAYDEYKFVEKLIGKEDGKC